MAISTEEQRAEWLRWNIYVTAREERMADPNSWVRGHKLQVMVLDREGKVVEDEEQFRKLLADCVRHGLLDRRGEATAPLAHQQFRSTKLADELWFGRHDPIPGVRDPRLEER